MIQLRFVLVLVFALLGAADAWAQPDIQRLRDRVMDDADILARATEDGLRARLAAHEDSTSNQVVVWTVKALGATTVEELANRAFNTWGLGQEATDNGVLLLVARDDRELRIEVGQGLEGALTDAQAGRIIRNEIVPRFRSGDFDGGVTAGVDAILGSLDGTYIAQDEDYSDDFSDMPLFFRLVFGGLFSGIPLTMAFLGGLFAPGCARYFMMLFFIPFVGIGTTVLFGSPTAGIVCVVIYLIVFLVLDRWIASTEWGQDAREKAKQGKSSKIYIGGIPITVGGSSSSGGGGGFSSGGFSGGGGFSSGGGASGSW
ncbi:MAG: TPM domain-containing protein [Bacteroidota bacterium]